MITDTENGKFVRPETNHKNYHFATKPSDDTSLAREYIYTNTKLCVLYDVGGMGRHEEL